MTTKQIQKIGELSGRGLSDVKVGKLVGCSTTSVWSWRKTHGKPPNGHCGKPPRYEYRVYDARSDRLLAFGTARECTEMLGLASLNSFYSAMSRCRSGKRTKYGVRQDRISGMGESENRRKRQ